MATVPRLLRLRNPITTPQSLGKRGSMSLCFVSHPKEETQYKALLRQSSQGGLDSASGSTLFQDLRVVFGEKQGDGGGEIWRQSGCSSSLSRREQAQGRPASAWQREAEFVDSFSFTSAAQNSAQTNSANFRSMWMGGHMNTSNWALIPHGLGAFSPIQMQCRTFVQLKTKLTVADNSGAKVVECIKVMNKTRLARLGDTIIASVKEVVGRGKVKKGEVVYCVIVRARMPRRRSDGSEVRFDDNAAVIINKQGEPVGTRIMGPVCHELRRRKMVKVLSLAEHVA